MSCSVSYRHSLDLALLWLWHRPAAAVPIQPLACELPYAEGVALKRQKKKKNKPKHILYFLIFEDSEIMVEEEKRRSRDTR